MKKVIIASDHRGVLVCEDIESILKKYGYATESIGSKNPNDIIDYVDCCNEACQKVLSKEVEFGILICGTGVGMCMRANRFKGIRAVLCDSLERVYFARKHEDCNMLIFQGGYSDGKKNIKTPEHKFLEQCLIEFLTTDFEGGRHINRIQKLDM